MSEGVESQVSNADAMVVHALSTLPAVIASAADEVRAVDSLNILSRTRKGLDATRDSLVRPMNEKVREINGMFKPLLERLEKAEVQCKQSLLAWRESERKRIAAEQERVRRENEERIRIARIREEQERARIAIETMAAAEKAGMSKSDCEELAALEATAFMVPAVPIEVAPAPQSSMVSGSVGKALERKVWKMTVEHPMTFVAWALAQNLAARFIEINEAEVRRVYLPKGEAEAPSIPGLKFERVEDISARRY